MGAVMVSIAGILAAATPAEEPKKSDGSLKKNAQELALPNEVKQYLAEKLPSYTQVTKKDYDAIWFRPDNKKHLEEFNRSLRADFDGNGKDDFALLMKGQVDGEKKLALIVVRAMDNGHAHEILDSYAALPAVRETIEIDPPGKKSMGLADDPDPEMKTILLPSILVTPLESCGEVRYYWEKDRWHKVYIGL